MVLGVILVGCGAPSSLDSEAIPASTAPTTPPSTTATTAGLDVVVTPDSDGDFPDDLAVSCGGGSFPIAALKGIRPLETADPGGVAEAIASFLEGGEGVFWPQEGWHILHENDSRVLLVARQQDGYLAFMEAVPVDGGWEWMGASLAGEECRLEVEMPEGMNAVNWRLDPAGEAVTPASTGIAVLLTERECVSGQEIGDRLIGPQVVLSDTSVFVAFAARRPEGDYFDCQGNPEMPFVVELSEPLGERELVAGLDTGIILDDYVP